MKKKIFTGVVTAMMLVFTMGTTVFADPSPTSDTALVQRTNELNKATTVESSGYNANNELITVSSKGVDKDVYREGNRQANAVASAQNGSATVMAMKAHKFLFIFVFGFLVNVLLSFHFFSRPTAIRCPHTAPSRPPRPGTLRRPRPRRRSR